MTMSEADNIPGLAWLSRLMPVVMLYVVATVAATAQMTGHWGDQGDGTYRNPILAADYSDPDPLRVGDDYYLAVSTFESHPGVTILHSHDLVNWTTIGAALWDLAEVDSAYTAARMGRFNGGAYAPTLSYHNGRYYIYVNLYTDGFYMATAENPAGPWTSDFVRDKHGRPLRVTRWSDPCPFWDDDGGAYLVASHPGREYWYSYLFQMSPDGTTLLDADSAHMDRKNFLYQYPDGGTVVSPYHSSEGNRIFKRDGYYYLQHIEFTNRGLGEGTYIFRSRNLYGTLPDGTPGSPGHPGEYEIYTVEHVTSRDSLRLPGQGGYVDTPDGRWFWIGQFTRDYACGRPPHLLPVTWVDGWPVIGVEVKGLEGQMAWQLPKPISGRAAIVQTAAERNKTVGPIAGNPVAGQAAVGQTMAGQAMVGQSMVGQPIATRTLVAGDNVVLPQGSDDFSTSDLNPQWMWSHVPNNLLWSLSERPGYMRLYASPTPDNRGFFGAGGTLCQRYMRSDSTTVTVSIAVGGMAMGQLAGLAHFNGGKSYAFIGISCTEGAYKMVCEHNGLRTEGPMLPARQSVVELRTVMSTSDMATFQYSLDGVTFFTLGEPYPLQPGNFRGDMIGLFTYEDHIPAGHTEQVTTGYVDVDWFRYEVCNR